MTWRYNETRNTTAVSDLTRARNRAQKPCEAGCGAFIDRRGGKRFCAPCYAIRLEHHDNRYRKRNKVP